jgi:paraquat-inducible protein B
MRFVGGDLPHLELPTVRSGLAEVMNELSEIPFKQIFLDLQSTLQGVDERVKSEEVTTAINSVSATLEEFRTFGGKLNERIDPLVTNIEATSTEARETLAQAKETIRGVGDKMDGLRGSLDETLARVRELIENADAEVKPTADELRETMESLQTTLRSIDTTAKQAGLLLRDDSPTVLKVKQALDALADAARAFEVLSDTIKKQPESLLRGKRGG